MTALSVAPSSLVAGAPVTYSVGFTASDAASTGGYIYLTESAGPTNFTTVSGIEVIDTTQNWRFVASGAVLTNGRSRSRSPTRSVPVTPSACSSSGSPTLPPQGRSAISRAQLQATRWPLTLRPTDRCQRQPGCGRHRQPHYNRGGGYLHDRKVRASATVAGGSGTIQLDGPGGPFPEQRCFLQHHGLNQLGRVGNSKRLRDRWRHERCDFTVPNTINSGDVITLTVADVVNPSTASASDSITIHGAVTGPPPSAATTTTTVPPTTTTTKPPVKKVQHPTIADPTSKADVSKAHLLHVELKCTVEACKGYVTLTDVSTDVGSQHYSLRAGAKGIVVVHLLAKGIRFLAGAKHHTIKVTATVTVSGGKTVKERTTLVG